MDLLPAGMEAEQDALAYAQIVDLLSRNSAQKPGTLERLLTLLQQDIRRIAHRARINFYPGETVSTTVLINEAWLKLQRQPLPQFNDRQHFFGIVARAMRQILIDYVRTRQTEKRGGDLPLMPSDQPLETVVDHRANDSFLELSDALDRLEAARPRLARVVYLRYYMGLTDAEIGSVLDIEESTVRRDWLKARAWLYDKMS
jgi:RNA polymerase sigma factor (TIGR02999 family)